MKKRAQQAEARQNLCRKGFSGGAGSNTIGRRKQEVDNRRPPVATLTYCLRTVASATGPPKENPGCGQQPGFDNSLQATPYQKSNVP